jgi:Zn-dependent metalloprotease
MQRRVPVRAALALGLALAALVTTGPPSAVADSPALGSGTGVHVGQVPLTTTLRGSSYLLQDPTRGNTSTADARSGILTDADNVWGDGLPSNRQSAAVDAQFAAVSVWDYFAHTFNRAGVANDGRGIRSVVHYGTNYTNAFWSDSCGCVSYGDGADGTHPPTALDVAAHEITHGVTSTTAALVFSGEAGGLNEATSDIFATMVEFYAALPADVPDYLIGEKVDLNGDGTPLRYLDRPSRDGASADYWSSSVAAMDPWYAAGVADHFFFLLAEGSGRQIVNQIAYDSPTADNSVLTGIGRDKAAAVWYRALTAYLTSTANYRSARTATLNAARDLYGTSGTEYAAVAAAWTAVNVT